VPNVSRICQHAEASLRCHGQDSTAFKLNSRKQPQTITETNRSDRLEGISTSRGSAILPDIILVSSCQFWISCPTGRKPAGSQIVSVERDASCTDNQIMHHMYAGSEPHTSLQSHLRPHGCQCQLSKTTKPLLPTPLTVLGWDFPHKGFRVPVWWLPEPSNVTAHIAHA